jgi:hypothetical protein
MLFFSKFGPSQLVPPFLFFVLPPFCWLVLYGPPDEDSKPQTFPRTLLCIVTVLQTLYAYPIAGSQFVFVQVLPVVVAMICLSDYLAWQQKRMGSLSPILMGAATPVLLLCVATSYVAIARIAIKRYDSLPSLQLPGSVRIHVEEAQARDYRWLVRELDDHCDVFVGLPELPSLHVWTGKDPLEGMEMDDWLLDTSDPTTAGIGHGSFRTPKRLCDLQPRPCKILGSQRGDGASLASCALSFCEFQGCGQDRSVLLSCSE